MASPYGSLGRGQYTNADVMEEMYRAGTYAGRAGAGAGRPQAGYTMPQPYYEQGQTMPQAGYTMPQPYYGQGQTMPQPYYDEQGQAMTQPAYFEQPHPAQYQTAAVQMASGSVEAQRLAAEAEAAYAQGSLYEGAVDVRYGERRVIGEHVLDHMQQVIKGVRPIYTFEKIVEVPQTIVKEYDVYVPKPEIIERVIEVPKTELKERHVVGPPQVQYQEQIVEVPQVVIEERVVHVPRREKQERLIEIPKVEYVERIEFDDYIEYREVPVDKFVEVPEIEYHVREVEQLVPQTYIQEYYIDRYKEVPVTQMQEVAREERVPMELRAQQVPLMRPMRQAWQQPQQPQPQAPGITIAVPKGSFGPARVMADGGEMFRMMDKNRDGSISADEARQAVESLAAPRVMQSYASYDPGQELQSAVASAPVGSTFAVPKGTFKPGQQAASPSASMMPGSMQYIPGYGPVQAASPPTPPVPYGQSAGSGYNPFMSYPPVPAY